MRADQQQDSVARAYAGLSKLSNTRLLNPRTDAQLRVLLDVLPADPEAAILDAGCGSGVYSATLAAAGWTNIRAVDLFPSLADSSINYTQGSIAELPFPDRSFASVFANSVIYYLPDLDLLLRELHRVLQGHGTLVVTGHTRNSLPSLYRRFLLTKRSPRVKHLEAATFRATKEYEDALADAGFDVLAVDGYGAFPLSRRLYLPLVNYAERRWGLLLPMRTAPNRYKLVGHLQSRVGYHFVIVAAARDE